MPRREPKASDWDLTAQCEPGRRPGNSVGKKRPVIDWKAIDDLAFVHPTSGEVANHINVPLSTLERATKDEWGMTIGQYLTIKSGKGKIALRMAQWERAHAGSDGMLVWLGKQWLGQMDRVEKIDAKWAKKQSVEALVVAGREALEALSKFDHPQTIRMETLKRKKANAKKGE